MEISKIPLKELFHEYNDLIYFQHFTFGNNHLSKHNKTYSDSLIVTDTLLVRQRKDYDALLRIYN